MQQFKHLKEEKFNNLFECMKITRVYIVTSVILLLISLIGLYAYSIQLQKGLIVTGMSDRVFYGYYVINFVFFIGISHAGMLISALLRVLNVEWRKPITRMAEGITVFSLLIGTSMILIDMGRIERMFNVIFNMNISSPIVWDFLAIFTYLLGSILFLYLTLIPDLAILRDRITDKREIKFKFYNLLALRWNGTPNQTKLLEQGISIMTLIIIPIAIAVHTAVSWIFSMTWRPGWHSTIFGPYFVVGAVFSGIATILIAMAIFRKFYNLDDFITEEHFQKLSLLLLVFALLYLYFTISEYLTIGYTNWKEDASILGEIFYGQFAWIFWTFFIAGLMIPIMLLIIPRTRTIKGIVFASILVNFGMWLKRYIIIIPTASAPIISGDWVVYTPTWVELVITITGFVILVFLMGVFSKVFPIISIWEVYESNEKEK
ncbi:MAG: NrfD/PsrC family molybdoenzyme membrane anchor subunit [Candidatus Hodarchaeales archaeon]|jgi:molybdopterin-containing oxidoreductase family membrane subunit